MVFRPRRARLEESGVDYVSLDRPWPAIPAGYGLVRYAASPMLYELWRSDSDESYSLRYFPDVSDRHVRPRDERIVWTTHASSYEEALQARNDFLEWGEYKSSPYPWEYPPAKRTFLAANDYGMGAVYALFDARSAAEITAQYPEFQVLDERPEWLTPERQWNLWATAYFDMDAPPSGYLAELIAERR